MPALLQQIARFAGVGGIATLVHVALGLLIARHFAVPVLLANTIAFMAAVGVSYLGNHGWTFARIGRHDKHFPRFLLVSFTGLALNQLIVYAAVYVGGFDYVYGLAVVVVVVPALSVLMSRHWAFADLGTNDNDAARRRGACS
jgi:putative flippase GtrA